MDNIKLSAKAESTLVSISAIMIAAGSAGLTAVDVLPSQYKVVGAAICGGLVTAGTTILAVWHKFVNVANAVKSANTNAP